MKFAAAAFLIAAGIPVAAGANADSSATRGPICFSPREIASTTPISDREIVFKLRNGKMWKNTLRANCPGLKFEGGFSWTIRGDTVCENLQTIEVLRRSNACLLGAFTPYEPADVEPQDHD